jgi:two-component system phosphate regulon response regulator PhoB
LPVPATRVLLVDDDQLQRDVLADVLASEGYEVRCAATGAEALASARANPPDVLLLDLLLPDTDGATVLASLRGEPALGALRVIVTTGVRSASLKRLLGADAALFKPFGVRELLLAVGAVCPA